MTKFTVQMIDANGVKTTKSFDNLENVGDGDGRELIKAYVKLTDCVTKTATKSVTTALTGLDE